MRASVLSPAGLVTRTVSEPSPLMVPAKTVDPVVFSTGTDSPVMGAWLTLEAPATTSPSKGMRAPLRTRIRSSTRTSAAAVSSVLPSSFNFTAVVGASSSSEATARLARVTLQVSSSSAKAKRKTTAAPSAASPMAHAPATATVMRTFMSNRNRRTEARAPGRTSAPPVNVPTAKAT